ATRVICRSDGAKVSPPTGISSLSSWRSAAAPPLPGASRCAADTSTSSSGNSHSRKWNAIALLRTVPSRESSSEAVRLSLSRSPGPAGRPRLERATPAPPPFSCGACHPAAGRDSSPEAACRADARLPLAMAASLQLRTARARADYDACVRLQREVWGLSDLEITSAIQLIA